jgi:hypothetical protein
MLPFCHPIAAIFLVSNEQLRDDLYSGDQPSSLPFFFQF